MRTDRTFNNRRIRRSYALLIVRASPHLDVSEIFMHTMNPEYNIFPIEWKLISAY